MTATSQSEAAPRGPTRAARRTYTFARSTDLAASAERVWRFVTTMQGVNHELHPLVHMTAPREATGLDISAAPTGVKLFRSFVLAFFVFPIDYDDIHLAQVDRAPPYGFVETSTMFTQRTWRHERVVEPLGEVTSRVTDRITFEPRIALLGGLFAMMFEMAFAHRHRRLAKTFGRV